MQSAGQRLDKLGGGEEGRKKCTVRMRNEKVAVNHNPNPTRRTFDALAHSSESERSVRQKSASTLAAFHMLNADLSLSLFSLLEVKQHNNRRAGAEQ